MSKLKETKEAATQTDVRDWSPVVRHKNLDRLIKEEKNFAIENGWIEYLESKRGIQQISHDQRARIEIADNNLSR